MRVDPLDEHDFEDVSYHGSPSYHCRFCDIWEKNVGNLLFCKPARAIREQEARDKEMKERMEYLRLVAERKRFDELHAKYGSNKP